MNDGEPFGVSSAGIASRLALALALFLAGCMPRPPAPAPAHEAMGVNAGFDTTWDAVIDFFGENNIPISTIERASGIVATSQLAVDFETAMRVSDCGTGGVFADEHYYATHAIYNILVRGDESISTVRVTVSYSDPRSPFQCQSTGVWERETETDIKRRAEGSPTEESETVALDHGFRDVLFRFPGAPFPTPTWAGLVGANDEKIVYPLIPTCRAWYHLNALTVRFIRTVGDVQRLGLTVS